MLLVTLGCQALEPATNDRKALAPESHVPTLVPTPFVQRGEYPERLGLILQQVFNEHGFSLPWIAVRAPDSSLWFVAERFRSRREFVRLYVRVTSEEGVTASITAYQFGPSDWAVLGRLFTDSFDSEAESIATEISRKLNH